MNPLYLIIRKPAVYPAVSDVWIVATADTNEHLSYHDSLADARYAKERYETSDRRRHRYTAR